MNTYILSQFDMLEEEFFQVCQRLEKEGFPTSQYVPEVDYFQYFQAAYNECHFWNGFFKMRDMSKAGIIDQLESNIQAIQGMEKDNIQEALLDINEEMLYIVKQCC